MSKFDTSLRDSQATTAAPISPQVFDYDAYKAYEDSLLPRNVAFAKADNGVLVYRRFRAQGVFYDACRDMKSSLGLQLGALECSKAYKADIANFLEPWYGIGYIASCFGAPYVWHDGQAPATHPPFKSCEEIINSDFVSIERSATGQYILQTIEYFLDCTKGRLPMSFSDVQSPLNMLSYLIAIDDLFIEMIDEPEAVAKAAALVTKLLSDFLHTQKRLIGDCLASPGHGFASSRAFSGLGASNDNTLMISPSAYTEMFMPHDVELASSFGGLAYHSCGNWGSRINMVKNIPFIVTADGAFTEETDPSPNSPRDFANAFDGSGITINARAVGNPSDALKAFTQLYSKKQKLIAVTYCNTPAEQETLYNAIHALEEQE